jgi:hypothetical protein
MATEAQIRANQENAQKSICHWYGHIKISIIFYRLKEHLAIDK